MRKIRDVLRLKWALELSHREVAASVGMSAGAVAGVVARATSAGLDWPQAEAMEEGALEAKLYGAPAERCTARPLPDPAFIHAERRRTGVTLALLHEEYLEQHPDGYGYTQFCEHYRRWAKRHGLSMRQVHRAGEKLFVDYSGKRPHLIDPTSGARVEVELFVAVLGASNYTYAEATATQRAADWIGAHVRALVFLGGVPEALVPDQLKSGVTRACLYEPSVQRTYEELARHYGTAVLPARPAHPRDKAKVEVGVQIAQRWILARLRNQTFHTLAALNERIAELTTDLNARRMRVYGASRRELFDRLDRRELRALPDTVFRYFDWKKATVNIDYHVEFARHYYSVPHALVHEEVEVRATATTIEVFRRCERVASHVRDDTPGRHTTCPEHMPKAHQKHLEWTPTRIVHWAAETGPNTRALAEAIMAERPHPEQGYRSCLGILRLGKRYGTERLEAACARALAAGARSYTHVASILKHGLDRLAPAPHDATTDAPHASHENIRGGGYYH